MHERLSDSEKEELKSKLTLEGKAATSDLLEKLSVEISRDFNDEKNPGIYKESIKKMLSLKQKIEQKTQNYKALQQELQNLSAHLSEERKKEFYHAIEGAREILKNSHDLISDIKDEVNIFTPTDNTFTTKVFGQNLIHRAKNPKSISDQFLGGGIGLFNSGEAIAKITVGLLIGVGTSIPDTYKILTGKAETDAFKNI